MAGTTEGNQGQGTTPAGTSVLDALNNPPAGEGNAPGGTTDRNQGAQGQPAADPGWLAGVDAETRTKYGDALRSHKTVGEFVNAAMEAKGQLDRANERLQGAVTPPGEGATTEQIAAYRKALGVPESSDRYTLERAELPEGMSHDNSMQTWFSETAHKLNLSQAQAGALFKAYNDLAVQRFTAGKQVNQAATDKANATMKNEFGEQYEGLRNKAALILKKEGGDELAKFLESSGLGNNPLMIRAMIGVAKKFSEDYFVDGSPNSGGQKTGTPGEYSFPNTPGME